MDYDTIVKNTIISVLLILVFVFWYKSWRLNIQVNNVRYEAGQLAQELTSSIEVKNREVVITYRAPENHEKVVVRKIYIPAEGKVDVTTRRDRPQSKPTTLKPRKSLVNEIFEVPGTSGTVVNATYGGFTLKPGCGVIYDFEDHKLWGEFDVKFLYYKRMSMLVFTSLDFGGLALSYHIDQFFPEDIAPYNLEAALFYGVKYKDMADHKIGIGLRMNF